MDEWSANPVVWTLVGLAIVAAAGRFWYWRGQVDSDRDKFKNFMNEIGGKIDNIQENIHELLDAVRSVSKPGSPSILAELGNQADKRLDLKDIIPEYGATSK